MKKEFLRKNKIRAFVLGQILCLGVSNLAYAQKHAGAGVFFITENSDGELYTFLGERKSGSGWVNLGGLRDPEDSSIEEAAAREVFEESMGLITLDPKDLAYNPYADLVSTPKLDGNGKHKPKKQNYRMYFQKVDYFSENLFFDRMAELSQGTVDQHLVEMNSFGWFRLKDIMKHLTVAGPAPELFDVTDIHGKSHRIKLFNPLQNMLSQQKVIDYYGSLDTTPVIDKTPAIDDAHLRFQGNTYHYTQTEAHLKLVLGDKYVENDLKQNIDSFLRDHHDPFYASEKKEFKKKIIEYKSKIASLKPEDAQYSYYEKKLKNAQDHYDNRNIDHQKHNESLKAMLLKALEEEQKHKDKVVFYHGSESHLNFLWDVLTEFRREMFDIKNSNMKVMRSVDSFFKDINNINDFTKKIDALELSHLYMSPNSKKETKYNYLPDYGLGGLSVNVSLFGNHKYKGSSSFAYLLRAHSERPAPSLKILQQFFNILGLDDEEIGSDMMNRLQEYTNIFLKHFSSQSKLALMKQYKTNTDFLNSADFASITDSDNGVMLQIFLDPNIVNTAAHITELVGDRIDFKLSASAHPTNKPTDVLGMMRDKPKEFESELKNNHRIFQNQQNPFIDHVREDFDKDPNFIHANVLEARLLLLPEMMMDPTKVITNTYYLRQINQEEYLKEIRGLVKRDVQKIRNLNPHIEGYFSGFNKVSGTSEVKPRVNSIMLKGFLDSWDVERVNSLGLINKPFSVTLSTPTGIETKIVTPLEYALSIGKTELALEIMEKGGRLTRNTNLTNVFKMAIDKDKLNTFITIIKNNPEILLQEIDQKNMLSYAIEKKSINIVTKILSLNSPVLDGYNPFVQVLKQAVSNTSTYKDYMLLKTFFRMRPQYIMPNNLNPDLDVMHIVDEAIADKNNKNNRLSFIKKKLEKKIQKNKTDIWSHFLFMKPVLWSPKLFRKVNVI